ncbi:OPT super [Coemansia nantahalensis]|uniref:OPT super n=1 Tax=Coemansia nantahalensis TaxID=2789366 RepID=A0ACC1K8X7_9FUNG|nr:OPT super [Coemansia nantahalensis]
MPQRVCDAAAVLVKRLCGARVDGRASRAGRHAVDETQTQFTWRAVAVGLAFGTLLCFSNLWFGLQSGWISMMSLQASLVGFAVFKAAAHVLAEPFGPAENVVLQSTAVATATMPLAGGFVGILPALKMLGADEARGMPTELGYGQLCAWGLALAFFGVFFGVPLRRQTIVREKLRFPSGTATAQMISVLHNRPDPTLDDAAVVQASGAAATAGESAGSARRRGPSPQPAQPDPPPAADDAKAADDVRWATKLAVLGGSFLASGGYALLAHFVPAVNTLPVFGLWASREWAWNLMPSLSYAGQGIIMGLPTCLWMLAGAVAGWAVLSPVARLEGWAPGPVTDWKSGSRGWILWVSLAVMIAESVVSLAVVAAKELRAAMLRVRSYRQMRRGATAQVAGEDQDEDDAGVDARFLVPGWVTWGGLAASTVACMGIVWALFGIPMHNTLLAVGLALPLAVLGVRALGETDLNPVSGIGKVSQVVFAGVMPGNLVGNLVAGAIAEAGAQQAGDLMQDLKTGHLLRASPRAQFAGQMIGSLFSVFITAGAYQLYTRVYPIPSAQFPVPTAQVWLDMARLVNGHPLPPHVWPFAVAFACLFAALPVAALWLGDGPTVRVGPWRLRTAAVRRWWPSGIAFAMGIYNTPNFTLMRALGAVAAAAAAELVVRAQPAAADAAPREKALRRRTAILAIITASGFVLGEGTFAFFILLSQI